MRVLSLFDGMSCGQIALNRLGIKPSVYYASELDKYAIKVTQANYPDTIQLGDAEGWREWDIDWASIDLLIGGSPCQGFSFAGKQLAFEDPRSKLFFVYVDILNHIRAHNPDVKFLLENVKMKKEYLAVITESLFFALHDKEQWEVIDFSPTLINSSLLSAQNRQRYYWANWEFGQPEDKGIVLSDIVEEGVVDRDKSWCIDANYHKGGNLKSYFEKNRRQLVFSPGAIVGRKLDDDGKRNDNLEAKAVQCLEVQAHGKSRCLSTVAKDTVISPLPPWRYTPPYEYRKLTPIECERLQTVPDNYTAHVSNTQRYKMLGNGWTVDVICHILKPLIVPS